MARTPKIVEDRREQLLDAAMHVFAEKGFTRATNKDIARQAGITPGLIYHYFESKEALLMAIVEHRSPLSSVEGITSELLSLPAELLFRTLVQRVLSVAETQHFIAFVRMLLPELLNNGTQVHTQLAPTILPRILAFLSKCICAKIATGELRAIDEEKVSFYAQELLASVVSFVVRRQILHDATVARYSQEQVAAIVVDMFLHGLIAR